MKLTYQCSECEAETELDIDPIVPAKLYGPPESCYPAEGGNFEPTECTGCGAGINAEKVHELYEVKVRDDRDEYFEQKRQDRRDEE